MTRRELMALGRDMGAGLAAASLLPLAGCGHRTTGPTGVVMAPEMNTAGEGSLRTHAGTAGILTGCAVDTHALRMDARYRELLTQQCGIVVAENAMKWDALRPGRDTFDFTEADYLMDFTEKSGMRLRGHNLVWHLALPKWFAGEVYKGNAEKVMVEHISTVAGRYAGRLHSWDVVNEAIEPNDQRLDGLRNSPWLEMIGEDYIEIAFRAARQADPAALLTYNDYGIERDTAEADRKRTQVMMLLRRLKARNVPIDAVGIQSHLPAEPLGSTAVYGGLALFMAEARAMGLQVFITEMDVSDAATRGNEQERMRAVATTYHDYLHTVLAEPATKAVLTWGISGKHTWLNREQPRADKKPLQPLPFDGDYRALPAFYAMRDALDGRKALLQNKQDGTTDTYAPFKVKGKG